MTDHVTIAKDRLDRAESAQREALRAECAAHDALQVAVLRSEQAAREVASAAAALLATERLQQRAPVFMPAGEA